MPMGWRSSCCALALLAATACTEERERVTQPRCESWFESVQPALADCTECHGGDAPAGSYRLTSYLDTLGPGTDDVPNAIAGDASSKLLTVLGDDAPLPAHRADANTRALLSRWTVSCELAYRGGTGAIHAGGIMNPADSDFHGQLLRDRAYAFEECSDCHGGDFSGGSADSSCLECHPQGPTDCSTCHGSSGPTSGLHQAHREPGRLDKSYDCTECHVTPTDYRAPGHILLADGTVDPPPAEVEFGPFSSTAGAEPSYDPAPKQCSNVYCHGGAWDDGQAQRPDPLWQAPDAGLDCASCHGMAPESHAGGILVDCETCHQQVRPPEGMLITALHLDGQVQIGRDGDRCSSCHGGEGPSPSAPPLSLLGASGTDVVGVGAHQVHLNAPTGWTNPVACQDCHQVPSNNFDPGHIDTLLPAEVFADSIRESSLAFADGAQVNWSGAEGTCATYCHGSGESALDDMSPDIDRAPRWTAVPGEPPPQVLCGGCHGIPPTTFPHQLADFGLTDCADCHGAAIDGNGNIIFTGPPGEERTVHMNGVVDL